MESHNAQIVAIKAVQDLIVLNMEQQNKIDELKIELKKMEDLEKKYENLKSEQDNIKSLINTFSEK